MASYHLSIKSGKKGKAAEHAAYIAREGKHGKNGKREDLLALEHGNLPEWANGNPDYFWRMADKHERKNGAAYREFEIALPRELTLSQNLELVREFIKEEVGDKPYQVAIHAPAAALGDDKQPHSHIIISDKKPDGIVRTPEQHFKRYNSAHPELGGCKKDSGGREPAKLKEEVISRRKLVADIQNRHLEMHGYDARVDYRSNRDRGIEADAERHLGSAAIKKMTCEEKLCYKKNRQGKQLAQA